MQKILKKINDVIRESYPKSDLRYGLLKQIFVDGRNQYASFEDGKEPEIFTIDDSFELQIGHVLNGGKPVNGFGGFHHYQHSFEMLVISKKVKFYHLMDILSKDTDIILGDYDLRKSQIINNVIGFTENYPEVEAYIIKYSITTSIEDLL